MRAPALRPWLPIFVLLAACGAELMDTPEDGFDAEEGPSMGPGGKADDLLSGWPAGAPLPEGCDPTARFESFFAPDDPTVTLELSMIDAVRQALRDSGEAYPEGENPYRIRYAVYNVTNEAIVRRLVLAETEGVDVQVLIEADKLSEAYFQGDDLFRDHGLEVAADHTRLDDAGRRSADLIGITGSGLMHLKTRLFGTPRGTLLLTGSMNPNGSAGANEESLYVVSDPRVVGRYQEAYEAVRAGAPLENRWDDEAAVNVLFTPAGSGERAATRLLRWIEEEEEQILIMVFSLREVTSPAHPRSLTELLIAKHRAGVPVLVITDRKQADGVDLAGNAVYRDDPTEDRLRAAGIPVYEALNDAARFFGGSYDYAAMHHKSAILGRTRLRVVTDAANWTAAALGSRKSREKNVESVLFLDTARLDDGRTGRRHLAQWMRVLDRYAFQSVARDAEAPFPEVAARLLGLPGWPEQPVAFSAEAETELGEEVHVVGDDPGLGAWGAEHAGVRLSTDAKTYPLWSSGSEVALPAGRRFEWKLTARAEWGTRWESGENRTGFAAGSACGGDAGRLHGLWR